jgi:hypothetical protein
MPSVYQRRGIASNIFSEFEDFMASAIDKPSHISWKIAYIAFLLEGIMYEHEIVR